MKLQIPVTFDRASVPIDPGEPLRVMYDVTDKLAAWAYSRKFDPNLKPTGAPVPDGAWFVHEGGWHLGTGAMTMFPGAATRRTCRTPSAARSRASGARSYRVWTVTPSRTRSVSLTWSTA